MAEIITQQSILAGAAYAPVPGETRYAIAPGVVAVLNEAYEANVEAFEDVSFDAIARASEQEKVFENEKATVAERAAAAHAVRRIKAETLRKQVEQALTLQGGKAWADVWPAANRVVMERARDDFFRSLRTEDAAPPPSSEPSSPASPSRPVPDRLPTPDQNHA
jgi:hypothetical protein